jgi:hypothetical protein
VWKAEKFGGKWTWVFTTGRAAGSLMVLLG